MRGIIWDGTKLTVTDRLSVRPPGQGEVRVKVLASGICHSDLNMMGSRHTPTPVVLGHEAGGVVAEIGPGVEGWRVGDEVMVGTQTPCGTCRECQRGEPANCDVTWGFVPTQPFSWEGQPVYSFANVSSFAGEIVVKASQLYGTKGLPAAQAALIGCAVSTGYCAAHRLGHVRAGDRVAVIGAGGIGVNAIQGAHLAGAEMILAVDLSPAKEAPARAFGATHFLRAERDADSQVLAEALRAHGPLDIAIECSGAPTAVEAAIHGVKRGGRVVLIGMTRPGARACFGLDSVLGGREIVSTMNGGARPAEDYPALIREAVEGRLNIAGQVSGTWKLDDVEQAMEALRAGRVTRAILDHTA